MAMHLPFKQDMDGSSPSALTKLAAFIVHVLDLAASRYPQESDIDTPELALAERIKTMYGEYKLAGMDFAAAAEKARVDVVAEILNGSIAQTDRAPRS